jgi:hypothetical protein
VQSSGQESSRSPEESVGKSVDALSRVCAEPDETLGATSNQ